MKPFAGPEPYSPLGSGGTAVTMPPPPHVEHHERIHGITWLYLAWVVPAAFLIARQILGMILARQLLKGAVSIQDTAAGSLLTQLSRRFRIRHQPRLVDSPLVESPLCLGCLRPCIVLPLIWRSWPAEELAAVLTHELAHIERRDVLWQVLARLACAIHWFNPLAWFSAWRMRVERELACDDWVLRGGESATRYARWLLAIAESLTSRPTAAATAGVAMATRNGFEKRISAILDPQRRRFPVSGSVAIVLAIGTLALMAPVSMLSPLAAQRASAEPAAHDGPPSKRLIAITAPLPAKKAQVLGTVAGEDGKPVASAIVQLHSWIGGESVRSDANGRFALGVDERSLGSFSLLARTDDGALQSLYKKKDGELAAPPVNLRLVLKPAREFIITVNNQKRQPVAGAWVAADAFFAPAGEATTDVNGRATLRVPSDASLMYVIAEKPEMGLDYHLFWRKDEVHTDPYRLPCDFAGPITFTLHDPVTVAVRVIDDQQRPLSGVKVDPWYFTLPQKGNSANIGVVPRFWRMTNDRGIANLRIPADNEGKITFWTHLSGYVAPQRCEFEVKSGAKDVTVTMTRLVPVTGQVLDPAGKPVAGANVQTYGIGYDMDDYRSETRTDDVGRFQFDAPPDKYYIFVATKERMASSAVYQIVHKKPLEDEIRLTVQPTIRVFGRATIGAKNEPIRGGTIRLRQDDNGYLSLTPEQQFPGGTIGRRSIRPYHDVETTSDNEGHFEFYAGPGKYEILHFLDMPILTEKNHAPHIVLSDQKELEVNLHLDVELKRSGPALLKGRVVLQERPAAGVPEAKLLAQAVSSSGRVEGTSNSDGTFTINHNKSELYLYATTADQKMRGLVHVAAADEKATVPVGPTASATGRLVDAGQNAIANRQIDYGFRVELANGAFTDCFGGTVTTNGEGRFQLVDLVPGFAYGLNVVTGLNPEGRANTWRQVGSAKAQRAEMVELGDVILPAPDRPKTSDEYAAEAFAPRDAVENRLEKAQLRASITWTHIMVLLGSPDSASCRKLYELRYDQNSSAVLEVLSGYSVVAIDVQTPNAHRWADGMGVTWPSKGMTIVLLNAEGHMLAQTTDDALSVNGTLNSKRLIEFARSNARAMPDAQRLLEAALARAKREGKRVLVDESAPWCSWCVKLAEYVRANQAQFDRDFVFVTIDRRFENGQAVMDRLRKNSGGGIPWTAVLDSDGKLLITSDGPNGNIGYPSKADEQVHWEKMLRAGASHLTEAEIHELARKAAN